MHLKWGLNPSVVNVICTEDSIMGNIPNIFPNYFRAMSRTKRILLLPSIIERIDTQ